MQARHCRKKRPMQRRKLTHITLIAGCVAFLSGCQRPEPSLEAELKGLLALLPGVYAGTAPVPGATDGRTQTIAHTMASIEAPQFGQHVMYYQLTAPGPDGPVLQQKLFVFDDRLNRRLNRAQPFVFGPGQTPRDLHRSPEYWATLDPQQLLSFPVDCAFIWTPMAGGYRGEVTPQRCAFESPGFGQPIRPEMTYRVTTEEFVWSENLRGADGSVVATTGGALRATRQ